MPLTKTEKAIISIVFLAAVAGLFYFAWWFISAVSEEGL